MLRVPLARDHLSAISGVTGEGWLFWQERQAAYDVQAVAAFLMVLLRKRSGKLLIIWDGSPIHRAQSIKDFLKRGAARRLWLEQLPGYAPDLNPDQGIWNSLKCVELANLCCPNLVCLQNNLCAPVNVCATSVTLSVVALFSALSCFSCLCRAQWVRHTTITFNYDLHPEERTLTAIQLVWAIWRGYRFASPGLIGLTSSLAPFRFVTVFRFRRQGSDKHEISRR